MTLGNEANDATARPLSGRCALITGATGGLGQSIALGLARAGCSLVLHGLETEAAMAGTIEQWRREHQVEICYLRTDLASAAGAQALADAAQASSPGIDILINNAVVRHFAPIDAFPVDAWERALAVNVSAAFHLVRLLLPRMRERGWGRILNMASVYGLRGVADRIDYVTTKSALLGFTRAVAIETIGQGITCNALCPGSVLTQAIDARVKQLMAQTGIDRATAQRRFLAGKQPSGQFVDAGDVAELAVFLCGPAARDISGTMLPIDGGWLAG